MSNTSTYPLRLPVSLKKAVKQISQKEGTSINQFVAMAIAEKLSALETASFFRDRSDHTKLDKFDEIMNRDRGIAPIAGDEIFTQ
ncbi:MAG: toxin-antitoxin system HicB family antitoxin [Gammaproteobacteria bacterium]|nr:MAG: toxin-antitoxin system HicB family antitoxin [Gammaproteobacteria bacterium]